MKALSLLKNRFLTGFAALCLSTAASAGPITFDLTITNTNYQVDGTESAQDLIDAHDAGSLRCTDSLDGFEGTGPIQNCGSGVKDYSLKLNAQFTLDSAMDLTFQTGADWGRGGGVILTDIGTGAQTLLDLRSDNVWWARSWSNEDVFTTELSLGAGEYALTWIGFEDCCAGETTIRYSMEGSDFDTFTASNFGASANAVAAFAVADVPEPGTMALLGLGIAGFAMLRRRKGTGAESRAFVPNAA